MLEGKDKQGVQEQEQECAPQRGAGKAGGLWDWIGLERWKEFGKSKTLNMSVKKSIINTHSFHSTQTHTYAKQNKTKHLSGKKKSFSGVSVLHLSGSDQW